MRYNSKVVDEIKALVVKFLKEEGIDARECEKQVLNLAHQAGAEALGERWSEQAMESEPEQWECGCGRQLKRRQVLSKQLLTMMGQTEVNRSYYWCAKCESGRFWLDDQLGCRGRAQTAPVQEAVVLAVAETTYGGSRRLLETLAGLRLPHQTLESIAQDIGGDLVKQRLVEIEEAQEDTLSEPAIVPETLCISTDGVKVPMHEGWQEARVVAVFPYDVTPGGSEAEPGRITYSARVENCEETGKRMYAQAQKYGARKAKRVAVIGDGADWIWNQSEHHFPGAIEIVDWYHATQHLWAVGNALFGQSTSGAKQWEQRCEALLWEGHVKAVIAEMRKIFWRKRRRDQNFVGSETEHVLQTNMAYFSTHLKRMDYAKFRAEKLPIGSGTVESACKHYVAQRCKRSGMKWKSPGIHAVLELRAALLSDEWSRVQQLLKTA